MLISSHRDVWLYLFASYVSNRYNLKTEIELTKVIRDGAFIHARDGELFAKVPLNEELSEDTDAGMYSQVFRFILY